MVLPTKLGNILHASTIFFAIRNQIAVRYILVQKVSAGVNLPYRASRRKGNESPQTIQTSRPCKFSGGDEGGDVPLLHTAKNNIQSAGIKARPQNITHTHTKEDLKTMLSRWKQTQDCLRFPRMLF